MKRKQRIEAERAKLRRPSFRSAENSDDEQPAHAPVYSARSNKSTPNTRRNNNTRRWDTTPPPERNVQETPPAPPKPVQKPKPKPVKKRKPSPPPVENIPPEEQLPPTSGANDYLNILATEHDAAPQNLNLRPCPVCGRKFAVERLQKHQTACEKSKKKPRKVFDMTKQRTQGTDAAQFVRNRPKTPEVKKVGQLFHE